MKKQRNIKQKPGAKKSGMKKQFSVAFAKQSYRSMNMCTRATDARIVMLPSIPIAVSTIICILKHECWRSFQSLFVIDCFGMPLHSPGVEISDRKPHNDDPRNGTVTLQNSLKLVIARPTGLGKVEFL